jgi:PPOX class probable F420-dependent enzyme
MTAPEVRSHLTRARTMVLVTLGPDGVPDPVPMWFVLDADGRIRMRTYRRSQKVRNLRRDPRVSCLVEDGREYGELRGVQLTGTVELVEDPEWVADVVLGLRAKYDGGAGTQVAEPRATLLAQVDKQVGMRLIVRRTVSWDHRKLGGS